MKRSDDLGGPVYMTELERQVITLKDKGWSIREIARHLGMYDRHVSAAIRRAQEKRGYQTKG